MEKEKPEVRVPKKSQDLPQFCFGLRLSGWSYGEIEKLLLADGWQGKDRKEIKRMILRHVERYWTLPPKEMLYIFEMMAQRLRDDKDKRKPSPRSQKINIRRVIYFHHLIFEKGFREAIWEAIYQGILESPGFEFSTEAKKKFQKYRETLSDFEKNKIREIISKNRQPPPQKLH